MKRSKAKQVLKWSLPLGLALFLAACGSGSNDKRDGATPSGSSSPISSASSGPSGSPSQSADPGANAGSSQEASPGQNASPSPSASPDQNASPSASAATSPGLLAGFEMFTDDASGVEIQYPQDWALSHDVPGAIITFMTALEDGDKFRDNVSISMQDLGGEEMDLAQYVEVTEQQLQEIITDFTLLSEEQFATDDGLDIQVIKYTGKQGDFSLTWQQLLSIKNGKAYVLTYLAEDGAFDMYVETVGQMVETLVIY